MIRSALIALGLSAGAASAQGLVPTAPILDACGGTRMVLSADGLPNAIEMDVASDVLSARIGGALNTLFDYADVSGDEIIVTIPAPLDVKMADFAPLLENVGFGFHEIDYAVETGEDPILGVGQVLMASSRIAGESFVLRADPFLDGAAIVAASQVFDFNNNPAVAIQFNNTAAKVFATFTSDNIGTPFAIVLRGEVLTAPIIRDAMISGEGIIAGDFTVDGAVELAAILQGGTLPFDLSVVMEILVDGSNPSADFCP